MWGPCLGNFEQVWTMFGLVYISNNNHVFLRCFGLKEAGEKSYNDGAPENIRLHNDAVLGKSDISINKSNSLN